jgi:ribokinase
VSLGASGRVARHVALGNINLDVYLVVDRLPEPGGDVAAREAYYGPGGAAANYAVAVAAYGHKPLLVAHTGKLMEAMGVLGELERRGVDVSAVRVHEDEVPGLVVVLLTSEGERTMVTVKGANRLLEGSEVEGLKADVLHVASRETSVLGRASSSMDAAIVSYDPGARVAKAEGGDVVRAAQRHATILYLNRLELRYVSGLEDVAGARKLLAGRLEYIVVKLGAEGAALVSRDGVWRVEAYKPEKVVDVTGAGDVFAAYFNSALADGYRPTEALQYASIAAGIKVGRKGAQGAPSRAEVEEAAARRPPRVWRVA